MDKLGRKLNRFFDFLKKHKLVLVWGLISIVAAAVIHFAFYFPARYEWLVHQWEAGDILTYISTVALGLLAVWQNQKFKEENDKAQELMEQQNSEAQARLERINIEANELNVISRIIDQENRYLLKLEETAYAFLNASSINVLLATVNKVIDSEDPLSVTDEDTKMNHTYNRLMSTYLSGMIADGIDLVPVIKAFSVLYEKASDFFANIYKRESYDPSLIDKYPPVYREAEKKLNSFLYERRQLMYRVLTEKMTLEQICAIYSVMEGNIDRDIDSEAD